jgi:hypothetical protein
VVSACAKLIIGGRRDASWGVLVSVPRIFGDVEVWLVACPPAFTLNRLDHSNAVARTLFATPLIVKLYLKALPNFLAVRVSYLADSYFHMGGPYNEFPTWGVRVHLNLRHVA